MVGTIFGSMELLLLSRWNYYFQPKESYPIEIVETEHGVKYEKSVGNCSFTSQMTISATSLRVGLIKSDGIFV